VRIEELDMFVRKQQIINTEKDKNADKIETQRLITD
jgi:hypothetical protein